MKLWFKKISVILITFITLGMYIPPTYLDGNANQENDLIASSNSKPTNGLLSSLEDESIEEIDFTNTYDQESSHNDSIDDFIDYLTDQAKDQTYYKLGPKIVNQVEDDLVTSVLPNMEEVIRNLLEEVGREDLQHFGITEQPAQGYGEKIFKILDHRTNKDVVRFDVRRDNRPKDGYWFNFHYHLNDDNFEEHHDLGEVYWDKNTPPKWMS
ncbi:YpjP family protein [Evansella sp. AB-P1]|uniref:YpjP family protein n=1 Tax=Evansella sp. AB-P1 TaxID=3037653 RepID=UPI00241D4114|nr:YpjP family protein [Evansella sp. AB-P1]MDG5789097.1 YpjP family protein [Evansella sp. AB-P1]